MLVAIDFDNLRDFFFVKKIDKCELLEDFLRAEENIMVKQSAKVCGPAET